MSYILNAMSLSRNDWFPTAIWSTQLEDADRLNFDLIDAIQQLRHQDPKGEQWSNVLGWHSQDNLHQQDSFKPLMQLVISHVEEVAKFLKWDLQKVSLYITTCWAIANPTHASNSTHNHPNSILSGVYYVQVPENSGNIFFTDPRPGSQMLIPPTQESTPWTLSRVTYRSVAGALLLFPSWLVHGVEPNLSSAERIAISFNIGMTPKD
jgi:uncharacterized protein (TIGR02466 family)